MLNFFIFRFYISNHQGYRRFMDGKIKQTDFWKDLKTGLTDKKTNRTNRQKDIRTDKQKTTGLKNIKTTELTDR